MNSPPATPDTPPDPQYTPRETGNSTPERRLLDQVRAQIRLRHYSIGTATQYAQWIKRFMLFHHKRHPREMGAADVAAFLTHLAVEGRVASATQNQALSAWLFLHRQVLGVDLPWLYDVVRAKQPERLPVVSSRSEVERVLARMDGVHGLLARLLSGAGMRPMEVIRLHVKDVDFAQGEVVIGDDKGAKDRVTMLPEKVAADLSQHLRRRRLVFEDDLRLGRATGYLPDALERKDPNTTTMIHTHGLKRGGRGVRSPLDSLFCVRAGLMSPAFTSARSPRAGAAGERSPVDRFSVSR